MDFADLLIGRIERYYTKDDSLASLAISFMAAFSAAIAVFIVLTKSTPDSVTYFVIILGIGFLAVLFKTMNSGKIDNKNVLKLEKVIISNHEKISLFDKNKRENIIDCVDMLFLKKNKDEILTKLLNMLSEEKE